MEEFEITNALAKNITELRKANNLTQAELAEKLNYSDKSVSKWERGEGVPDIYTLKKTADFFGVSLDYLISEHVGTPTKHAERKKASKLIVSLLSVLIPWLIATVAFVMLGILFPAFKERWLIFIYAIPISAIIFLIFTSVWGRNVISCVFSSLICWSIILTVYLSLDNFLTTPPSSLWLVFLIGAPLQAMIILGFCLKNLNLKLHNLIRHNKKNSENK